MSFLALMPLISQALFTYSQWQKIVALRAAGTSREHSPLAYLLNAVAHFGFVLWAIYEKADYLAAIASVVAFAISIYILYLVMAYRR